MKAKASVMKRTATKAEAELWMESSSCVKGTGLLPAWMEPSDASLPTPERVRHRAEEKMLSMVGMMWLAVVLWYRTRPAVPLTGARLLVWRSTST